MKKGFDFSLPKYVAGGKSSKEEEIDSAFPLSDESDESQGSKKNSDSELGSGDLLSESEVDLGQGSIVDSDYPGPLYEQEYLESLEEYTLLASRSPPLSPPPSPPMRTLQEEALFRHVFQKSDGFEVPWFPGRAVDLEQWQLENYDELHAYAAQYEDYCKQAINEYNNKEGTRYDFKYLIKICTNTYEFNVTVALTDPEYHPFVGRFKMVLPWDPTLPPAIDAMRVTRGEYQVPRWRDADGNEYKCMLNEEFREKLPELEKEWRHKMHLD